MTTIQAQIPDDLFQQLQSMAEQENLPIEQVISNALAAQISLWGQQNYLQQRAQQGSWAHFQQVLTQVPNVEPDECDRL
jgi:predicted transcriptional regulator